MRCIDRYFCIKVMPLNLCSRSLLCQFHYWVENLWTSNCLRLNCDKLSVLSLLQEHNISPDTLITPAMVIKSKEEREARQRTEAVAAAAAAAAVAAVASSSSSPTPSSVSSVSVVATSTPSAPVPGSAAVVVGSANTPGVLPAARIHHHSHQQHPTIVTISGTGSPGSGSNIQRSANILVSCPPGSEGFLLTRFK